jgi:hypothetical protein
MNSDHATPLYPQKLALTSPTSGGRSVGIFRSRTRATELSLVFSLQGQIYLDLTIRLSCNTKMILVFTLTPIMSLLNIICIPLPSLHLSICIPNTLRSRK